MISYIPRSLKQTKITEQKKKNCKKYTNIQMTEIVKCRYFRNKFPFQVLSVYRRWKTTP